MALPFLANCAAAPVDVKDEVFYVDAGSSGAVTVNFLSEGSFIVEKSQWDLIREGMYCTLATSFGDFKAEIEKLCSVTPCNYEVQKILTNLKKRFARVEAELARRKATWQ